MLILMRFQKNYKKETVNSRLKLSVFCLMTAILKFEHNNLHIIFRYGPV